MHRGVTRAGTLNAANHISRLGIGTFSTQSTWVQDNHFSAANITFANDAGISGNGYDGQALAIRVDGDQCVFYNCRFLAWQDTLYVHNPHAKIYFRKCLIQGAVAFVFGEARAVFDHCVIRSVGWPALPHPIPRSTSLTVWCFCIAILPRQKTCLPKAFIWAAHGEPLAVPHILIAT